MKTENKKKNQNKAVKRIIISLGVIAIIYFSTTMYFTERFYFGSAVNSVDISGKTVDEAGEEISSKVETYTLKLEGRDNLIDEIKGADIALRYNGELDKIQDLKDKQNPFKWFTSIFFKKDNQVEEMVSYDDELLNEIIDELSCFNNPNVVESKNPGFEYTEKGYEIVPEVYGNNVNRDILYQEITKAIQKGEPTISLEAINCYKKPQYTVESQEIIDAKNILDKYVSTKITYKFGDREEYLDANIINTWLSVDEGLNVIINETKVKSYIETLGATYNTAWKTRSFATSLGTTAKVSGGDYGWLINTSEEMNEIIAIVKEGKEVTKEPKYSQKAASRTGNDIGNTYVEINLTTQHIWFYKNGSLVVEGPIVTGDVKQKHATPGGTYILKYKQRDTVLRGEDYASPVSYWMPFNGGIGLHDATWRSQFGGNIYVANGSHGCVNLPFSVASTIFNNIEANTPIVCYF